LISIINMVSSNLGVGQITEEKRLERNAASSRYIAKNRDEINAKARAVYSTTRKIKKMAKWDAMSEEEKAHQKEKSRIISKRSYDNMPQDKKSEKQRLSSEFNKTDEGKARIRAQRAKWTDEHKARVKVKQTIASKHYKDNMTEEQIARNVITHKLYKRTNKEKIATRNRERYKTNPIFALQKKIRARMREMMVNGGYKKTEKTLELLGCTWNEAVTKLEDNPQGLKLNDKGVHIDHIRPMSSFPNLNCEFQQRRCSNINNLQLLTAKENLMKTDKFNYDEWCVSESGQILIELNRKWRLEKHFAENRRAAEASLCETI
jgi:hypothetical protein